MGDIFGLLSWVCILYIFLMRAKLFPNGGSQAVRLPKEFRFNGDEVEIERDGDAVVLRPLKKRGWPEGFFESIRIEDESFARPEQPPMPEQAALTGESEDLA